MYSNRTTKKELQRIIDEQQARIKQLECSLLLEDLPEETGIDHIDHAAWKKHHDAALDLLSRAVEWAGRNYGNPHTDPLERQAAGIGTLLSQVFRWSGTYAFLTAAEWLEDSNWHTEARTLYHMYEVDLARFSTE